MKPIRVSMLRMKGCLCPIQIWRASATSGRFCSTARRSFFVCQTEAVQVPPDRAAVGRNTLQIAQFDDQFIKGQVALFPDPAFEPVRHAGQLAMPSPVALRLGLKGSGGALQKHLSFTNLIETRNCAAAARCV